MLDMRRARLQKNNGGEAIDNATVALGIAAGQAPSKRICAGVLPISRAVIFRAVYP
jgi:hypothetical protein